MGVEMPEPIRDKSKQAKETARAHPFLRMRSRCLRKNDDQSVKIWEMKRVPLDS